MYFVLPRPGWLITLSLQVIVHVYWISMLPVAVAITACERKQVREGDVGSRRTVPYCHLTSGRL